MEYCVIKNTTKVIDGSENHILVMRDNAIKAGFTVDEIEILTEEQYKARKELEPKPIPKLTEEQQRLLDLELAMSTILGGGM